MENKILFSEQQKFRQWWVLLIFIAINAVFLSGVYVQVILGQQFGDRPMGDGGLIITTFVILILTLTFLNFRLDTIIKSDGIYVRFFPIHIRYKHYGWESLQKCYVRKYSPVTQYGGWGLRFGFFGNGNAYNVSGDDGLQLEFGTNKKLLIGTNKPEELRTVLEELGQLKS